MQVQAKRGTSCRGLQIKMSHVCFVAFKSFLAARICSKLMVKINKME